MKKRFIEVLRLRTMQQNLPHISQNSITLTIKILTVTIASIAFFGQDLATIFNDALKSETTSYALAIPFIFAYLVYRKRKMLRAVIPFEKQGQPKETKHLSTIAGILLSVTAILLYWYGSYTFTPLEYHLLALPMFAAGLILVSFNPQTLRQLIFPMALLAFLTPPPSEILYGLGATLSFISSEASNMIVNALGVPSTLLSEYDSPVIMITRQNGTTMSFTVDIACSGVYSLLGFLIFALFIAYIIRDKPWKKLTLFLFGLPLVYLLNIIRITSILLIGYHCGEETALEVFHLLGGWTLVFLGTLLLLGISEKMFKIQIFSKPAEKCLRCNPKTETRRSFCFTCGKILKHTPLRLSRNNIMKIVAIIASTILLMSIQVPVFALTQGPPIVILNTPYGQQVSTNILPEISGYDLDFMYRDTNFEERTKQDMALAYLYAPTSPQNEPMWVTIEISSTRSSLHPWEKCLITWPITHGLQSEVTQIELKDIQLVENPPIIGRYFVFEYKKTNETQAVLYWFETATFTVNATSQQKHVKISLIAYPDSPENLSTLENQLSMSAIAVARYWEPTKTWSEAVLFLSAVGDKLAALTIMTLAGTVILSFLNKRKERKMNFHTYKKLSKPIKQIIDVVHETEKTGIPTLNNIATTYLNMTGQPIDKEKLLHELSAIEKTGILESVITGRYDEPILMWKTQLAFK